MLSAAEACGPDFPTQLLDDRAGTLKAYPANSFAYEATHLVLQPDRLKAVETYHGWYDAEREATARLTVRSTAEQVGLSEVQAKTVELMRTAATGDAAYGLGQTLPEAVRLYTAGAIDFNNGEFAAAANRFHAVLNLPGPDMQDRVVWAAYMLGEVAMRANQPDLASAFFSQARKLAASGAPDPMGLAVASFGEEAKQHFEDSKAAAENFSEAGAIDRFKHELSTAVHLYAQQAASGSDSGLQSLRIVAETVLADSKQLTLAVADQTTQHLLVAYALARIDNETLPPTPARWSYYPNPKPEPLNPILPSLIAAIEQNGGDHPEAVDRLAALAYRCGQYDLAEKMAGLASGPLSDWVRAKIALQKGDLGSAAGFYSSAAKAFRTISGDAPLEPGNAALMTGEAGVLALGRGEYVAALDHLFDVGDIYWGDVAHIAERVLTVDELKTFVDTRVPPVDLAKLNGEHVEGLYGSVTDNAAIRIRRLLARRLMREGHYQEALAYFPQQRLVQNYDRSTDKLTTSLVTDSTGEVAADYVKALQDAKSGWSDISRARALYRAATIARRFGMEILGYETAPDFAVENGAYDAGYGQESLKGPFITEGEQQRFAASAAKPDKRFHYRYVAAAEAVDAADLVPARSQAFAAILCEASGWLIDRDPRAGADLYKRYVKEGPLVPWATHFARACPEPDFDSAANLRWRLVWSDARHFIGRNRWSLLTIVAVFLGVGALALRSRRVAC